MDTASPRLSSPPASARGVLWRHRPAYQPLWWATLALLALGQVALFSASAHFAADTTGNSLSFWLKQVLCTVLGGGLLWWLSGVPYARYQRWAWPLTVATLVLLALTMVMGVTSNGSERWLSVGPLQFQPSELAKPAVALLMAQALSAGRHRFLKGVQATLAVVVLMALIFKQPNLSVTLLLGSLWLVQVFLAGVPAVLFSVGLPLGAYALYWQVRQTPYQWRRIAGWLNPWASPQDLGYNIIQAYYAIGSGGFWGRGFGNSIQKLYYLPFQYTDFIMAVMAEEWGFVGVLLVLGLYTWWGVCGLGIALRCPTTFGQYLAFGLVWLLLAQAIINLSVCSGLFPVTGVTLPFISYGGTSMMTSLAMVGMLLSISRHQKAKA